MFSASENRSTPLGFGRFLSQLAGLATFGFVVWAGLFVAAAWQHEQGRQSAGSRLNRRTAAATQLTHNLLPSGIRQ
jgi:hypothetical protein